jgi:hypothetical protein
MIYQTSGWNQASSIIHNGIILGSVCGFGGFDGEEFRSSSVTGRGIYVVDVIT